jgi:hypothetical protein
MDLKFNKSAEESKIEKYFTFAMDEIESNLLQGKRVTNLSFPIEIASEVRKLIDERLKDKSFNWLVAYKGINQLGKEVNFISNTIGDEKHFRLNYFGD